VGHNFLNPIYVLYAPGILIQLIANEGNGIICVDACGPCSVWGGGYIMVDDQCVLPSVESCKLFGVPGENEFVEWTCQPVCKVPYSDICKQEMIRGKIRESIITDCQPGRESSILSANVTHHFDGNTCTWERSD